MADQEQQEHTEEAYYEEGPDDGADDGGDPYEDEVTEAQQEEIDRVSE